MTYYETKTQREEMEKRRAREVMERVEEHRRVLRRKHEAESLSGYVYIVITVDVNPER